LGHRIIILASEGCQTPLFEYIWVAKEKFMEATKSNTRSNLMDWGIFLVSLVVMILLLMFADEWFWLALPFVLTYLAKGFNAL
jgi:hypothetical protein